MSHRPSGRPLRGKPLFDSLETRAMMTHIPAALAVEIYLAHHPQAEIQQATPAVATGTAQVSNTYNKYDPFSNYIGGSIGLQSFVDGLYVDVLHRQGTAQETAFWTGTLDSGKFTPYTVTSYFLQSSEAVQAGGSGQRLLPSHPPANIYTGYLGGDVGVRAFVDGLYMDVLQRAPDAVGEAYWVGQIENHDLLPAKITFSFLASAD
jgi:Domain of unknown function (DUF4214)